MLNGHKDFGETNKNVDNPKTRTYANEQMVPVRESMTERMSTLKQIMRLSAFCAIIIICAYVSFKNSNIQTINQLMRETIHQTNKQTNEFVRIHDKTIYMFGDSTIMPQYSQLCGQSYATYIDLGAFIICKSEQYNLTVVTTEQHSNWGREFLNQDFIEQTSKATDTTPDVVYLNGGLHFLHFIPYRDWFYDIWKNAEQIVTSVVNRIRNATNATIVLMTSHSICDSKYNDGYAEAVHAIEVNATLFAQECTNRLVTQYNMTAQNATSDCVDGVFTRFGVKKLNDRILRILPKEVKVLDAFQITDNQCEHTSDARHYDPFIVKKELQELFRIIV